ncbi:MAG: hypothetical protein K2Z81_02450, partial [Cyanobacteria bacterium]|nr:hypothetical protein [Cyanobacteriota bacterium]
MYKLKLPQKDYRHRLAVCFLTALALLLISEKNASAQTASQTYYVSKRASEQNSDGRSWNTA